MGRSAVVRPQALRPLTGLSNGAQGGRPAVQTGNMGVFNYQIAINSP